MTSVSPHFLSSTDEHLVTLNCQGPLPWLLAYSVSHSWIWVSPEPPGDGQIDFTPCLWFSWAGQTAFDKLTNVFFFLFIGTLCFCGLFHFTQSNVLPYEGQLYGGNEWSPRTQHSLLHSWEWNTSSWRDEQVYPEPHQCYGRGEFPTHTSIFLPYFLISTRILSVRQKLLTDFWVLSHLQYDLRYSNYVFFCPVSNLDQLFVLRNQRTAHHFLWKSSELLIWCDRGTDV